MSRQASTADRVAGRSGRAGPADRGVRQMGARAEAAADRGRRGGARPGVRAGRGLPAAVRASSPWCCRLASARCSAGREKSRCRSAGSRYRSASGAPSTAGSSRRVARSTRARTPSRIRRCCAPHTPASRAGGGGDHPSDHARKLSTSAWCCCCCRSRTGLVWLIDHLVFRKQREKAAAEGRRRRDRRCRSLARSTTRAASFPVAFIVLIVRAFIFEPFRIPSDSMMPTLLDGDFIVVNKFAYGLRWPVVNQKFLDTGTPQRGEVVVFRYPPDPSINYIKRLVGLPGDRIEVRDDHLVINGQVIALRGPGPLHRWLLSRHAAQSTETLGEHTHQVLVVPLGLRDVAGARSAVGRRRRRLTAGLRSQEDCASRATAATCATSPAQAAARTIRNDHVFPTAWCPPGTTS